MREHSSSYELRSVSVSSELRLVPVTSGCCAQSQAAVQSVIDNFDEDKERKKIITLNKKIMAENKKTRPDRIVIARYQREIVDIRQNIIEHLMKSTKR